MFMDFFPGSQADIGRVMGFASLVRAGSREGEGVLGHSSAGVLAECLRRWPLACRGATRGTRGGATASTWTGERLNASRRVKCTAVRVYAIRVGALQSVGATRLCEYGKVHKEAGKRSSSRGMRTHAS